MKIKCKICNTVYDNKEKYCPYCFNRTTRNHDCYNLNSEEVYSKDKYKSASSNLYEGKAIQNQRNRANSFNYQKRATTKFKTKKVNPLATIIPIIFSIIFFMSFLSMFFNMIFYF